MSNNYTEVTVSGYNSSPPSDDGAATEANKVKWDTIKTKLTDPLNTAIAAVDDAVEAAVSGLESSVLLDYPFTEIQDDDTNPATNALVGKWNVKAMANGNIIHLGAGRPGAVPTGIAKDLGIWYFMSTAVASKNVKLTVRAYSDELTVGQDWTGTTELKTTVFDDQAVEDDDDLGYLLLEDCIGIATLGVDSNVRFEIERAAATTNDHTGDFQVFKVQVLNG